MRRFVFAAFALVVLAACQHTTAELTEEQRETTAAEVSAAFDDWIAYGSSMDLDGYLGAFADSDELTLANAGGIMRSWSDYSEYVRNTWAGWGSIHT